MEAMNTVDPLTAPSLHTRERSTSSERMEVNIPRHMHVYGSLPRAYVVVAFCLFNNKLNQISTKARINQDHVHCTVYVWMSEQSERTKRMRGGLRWCVTRNEKDRTRAGKSASVFRIYFAFLIVSPMCSKTDHRLPRPLLLLSLLCFIILFFFLFIQRRRKKNETRKKKYRMQRAKQKHTHNVFRPLRLLPRLRLDTFPNKYYCMYILFMYGRNKKKKQKTKKKERNGAQQTQRSLFQISSRRACASACFCFIVCATNGWYFVCGYYKQA